jgi:hypothetical protein
MKGAITMSDAKQDITPLQMAQKGFSRKDLAERVVESFDMDVLVEYATDKIEEAYNVPSAGGDDAYIIDIEHILGEEIDLETDGALIEQYATRFDIDLDTLRIAVKDCPTLRAVILEVCK